MSRSTILGIFICFIFYNHICAQGLADIKDENLIYVSWGDQIVIANGDSMLDTPEKIQRSIVAWKENQQGKTILWRGSAYYIERFYEQRNKSNPVLAERRKTILAKFDPLKVAREVSKANGQKFLIYMTIFDHGCPATVKMEGRPFLWQDRLTQKHPEYQCVDRQGNYHWGVLEFAVPQARQMMINRICDFVKEFDTDGVYVCTRTHSPPAEHADQFGFAPQIVEEFKKRYGINILTDPRFDCKNPKFNSRDPFVEKWRKLRGEYFVKFFDELRTALPGKTIYVGIPLGRYLGPPYGNMYLDWESLVQRKLVDGLVTGVVSGRWLHPEYKLPHAKIGYLCSQDDELNIPSLEEAINKIYGPLCEKNGVSLFYNPDTNSCDPRFVKMKKRCPELTGFMLNAPDNELGTGYVEHSKELCFPGGQMTIEAFIMPRSRIPSWRGRTTILSKYDHTENGTRRGWEVIWNADGKIGFRVNQSTQTTGRGVDCTLKSLNPLPLGKWTHVACVYDAPAGKMKIYLNGKLNNTSNIANEPPRMNPNQELFLGRYGGRGYMTLFDGKMDELRLSNVARVFNSIPQKPYTGQEPGTIALYHFDNVENLNMIQDAVGHSFPIFLLNNKKNANLSKSMPGFDNALDMHLPNDNVKNKHKRGLQ